MDKAAVTSAAAPTAPQRESGRWSLTAARRIPCRAPPRSLAGEAAAVGVQHADAGLGVLAKALVGSGQLLERGQIESVALVGPVDANQQHVVVEIDGDALIQGRSSSPRLPVAIEASLRFERIADAARRLDDTVGLASTPKVAWV